jgi:serine/threonine protein kinase
MHARRIAHRDLKLENVLIADAGGDGANIRIKLVDFGLSRRLAPSPGARTGWTAAQAATAAGAALRAPASPQHSASDSLAVLGAPRRMQGTACDGASPVAVLQQMRRRGGNRGAKPPTDRRAAVGAATVLLAAGAQLEAAAAECRGVPRFHTTVGTLCAARCR